MTLLQTSSPAALPPTSPHDSVLVVQTPQGFRLPSGPSTLTRALFDRPQEVQRLAISVGVLLFAGLAFLALRYRAEVLGWSRTRSRPVTMALSTAAALFLVVIGLVGKVCAGCHAGLEAPTGRPVRRGEPVPTRAFRAAAALAAAMRTPAAAAAAP